MVIGRSLVEVAFDNHIEPVRASFVNPFRSKNVRSIGPLIIEKITDIPPVAVWKITRPTVTQPLTTYDQITVKAGDVVSITAGGCVQTGGHGSTWKRYVDPLGSGSDKYYHGTIKLPGMPGETTVQEFITNTKKYVIPDGSSGSLILGYTDDQYNDNGYYSHDDGNNDQCKNIGDAEVQILIVQKNPTTNITPLHPRP